MANKKLIDTTVKTNKPVDLNLTVTEFEKGGWGATAGRKFNPPLSVKKRFITSASGASPITWDKDAAFEEIAQTYLTYLTGVYPILNFIPLAAHSVGNLESVYGQLNVDKARHAVFQAIQFACENKNVWERVTGYSISTPNFTMQPETTGWIFSSSAWGHAAWATLQTLDLDKFEICSDGTLEYKGIDKNKLVSEGFTTDEDTIAAIKAWMLVHSDVFGGGSTSPDIHTRGGIDWLTDRFTGLTDFSATSKNYDIVKYNVGKDGNNNPEGFVLLVKTPGGMKEIRTWEEVLKLKDELIKLIDANKALITANTNAITALDTKVDGVEAKADKNTADIAQLASEIQYIENSWTGDRLLPSNGISDLSAVQGDKGAFDFTTAKKIIITFGANGHAVTDTKILRVGTQGSYHLVGEGVDATFGVTVADTGVLTIQNFASTGTTAIDMHDLIIKSIEQNPKAAAVIDAYTKAEADAKFELKGQGTGGGVVLEYTSAKELFDAIESGSDITNAATKAVNAAAAKAMIENQKEINAGFLSEFSDNVFFMNDTTMEYRDTDLGLVTLDATISTSGAGPVTVAYSSLISPYDRIAQDQASFYATMYQDGMKIQYLFTAKGKAVRFSGNTNSHYKWETVTKFAADGTNTKYIKFTGDATLEVNDNALAPTGTWTGHNMPYEVPLSDLMDSANRTALVQMTFTAKPAAGTKVASIDYKTDAHFYAQREEALFKAQEKVNEYKYAHKVHEYNLASFTHQTNYLIGHKPTDFDTLQADDVIKLDLSKIDALIAAPTTIAAGDGLFVGVDYPVRIPNSSGSAQMKWETKTNPTDTNVKDNYKANDLVVKLVVKTDGTKELHFIRWEKKSLGAGAQLTKVLTVEFSDGTTENFKVG